MVARYVNVRSCHRMIKTQIRYFTACAKRRKRVDERDYEVFGYLKAKHAESPVQMCRHRREMYLKQESPAVSFF